MKNRQSATRTSDPRRQVVDDVMKRLKYNSHDLLEILHCVQNCYGYLEKETLRFVAESLDLPLSKIYGVASFYQYFSLTPRGEHTVTLCNGTGCYLEGANDIRDHVLKEWHLRPGDTTPDGKVTFLTQRCMGACAHAPNALFDDQMVGSINPTMMEKKFQDWIQN